MDHTGKDTPICDGIFFSVLFYLLPVITITDIPALPMSG